MSSHKSLLSLTKLHQRFNRSLSIPLFIMLSPPNSSRSIYQFQKIKRFPSFGIPRTASTLPQSGTKTKPRSLSEWCRYWIRERPIPYPLRWSYEWWKETALIFFIFGITGSTTMHFVRPIMHTIFGLEGSLWDGPWSYRILSLITITPTYSLLLLTFGTLFGRHVYFKRVAKRMWSRLLPTKSRS